MKITKKTMLLAVEPIDQTPDGQSKILKATDNGQSETFTFGHEWIVKTVNMFDGRTEHAGIDWVFGEVMVCTNESVYGPSAMMLGIYSDDGTCLKINPDSGSIPPGTYANATINIMGLKHGETEPVILHIPITLVVEA